MSDINSVVLTGNLTRDPDCNYNGQDCQRAAFGLASTRKSSKGETTTFVECTAFGKTAAIVAQYARKGKKISVVGELELNRWTDQQGNNRQMLRVIARQIQLLSAPPSNAPGQHDHYGQQEHMAKEYNRPQPIDEENPF